MTCPNATCEHPADVHEHDPLFGDGEHCRVIGCWCGHRNPEVSRRLDLALLAISIEQRVARMSPWPGIRINQC